MEFANVEPRRYLRQREALLGAQVKAARCHVAPFDDLQFHGMGPAVIAYVVQLGCVGCVGCGNRRCRIDLCTLVPDRNVPVVFQVQGKCFGEFLDRIVGLKRPVFPVKLSYLDLDSGCSLVYRILVRYTNFANVIFQHGDIVGAQVTSIRAVGHTPVGDAPERKHLESSTTFIAVQHPVFCLGPPVGLFPRTAKTP